VDAAFFLFSASGITILCWQAVLPLFLPKTRFKKELTSQADSLNAISGTLTVLKAFFPAGVFFGPRECSS
jgi:hypothetical protein